MAEMLEPHVLDYPGGYTRSVGPVIGRFLTGLGYAPTVVHRDLERE